MPFFRATEQQGLAWTQHGFSALCEFNLKLIGTAARLYAADHNGRFPAAWPDLTNDLARLSPQGPQALYCPADAGHTPVSGWDAVDLTAISYELVTPGLREEDWQLVFARCAFHGNVVRGDGAVEAARPYDRRPIPAAGAGQVVLNPMSGRTAADAAWSVGCLRQLKQIGLAARLYALDNEDRLPPGFDAITNELGRPDVLFCPADLLQSRPASFDEVDFGAVSYVLDAANVRLAPGQAAIRLATCRIHGHFVDSDGATTGGTNRYPPCLILGHPLSQTVTSGRPATLAVLTGDSCAAPLRFQWRRMDLFDAAGLAITNTRALLDATNQTYEVAAAAPADEGYYDVIVADARDNRQLSHLAYLRVEPIDNPRAMSGWETNACMHNLGDLLLASRLAQTARPDASEDPLPSEVVDLIPFLGWPLALYCPADAGRVAPNSWEALVPCEISYLVSRSVSAIDTNSVFATCKVHGLQILADGRCAWPGPEAIRPELDPPAMLPDGRLGLAVRGIAGLQCAVEVSTNLDGWTLLAQDWLNDGLLLVTDPGSAEPVARFYRAWYCPVPANRVPPPTTRRCTQHATRQLAQ